MVDIIKNIINAKSSNEEKIKALHKLNEDIEIAKGILSGMYKYCQDCDDYYLAESFISKTEQKQTQICIYDPINSGGNEYGPGYIQIAYSICPKGHKHEVDKFEGREF